MPASALASLVDHTVLAPDATGADVERACDEALEYGFGAVFVAGTHIARCAEHLRGSPVRIGSVAGFPLGSSLTEVKLAETRAALERGAVEVDVVQNIGALLEGDEALVVGELRRLAEACHAAGATLKAILECCLLTDALMVRACELAVEAGADFVKTSTGFARGGATPEDVASARLVANAERPRANAPSE